LIRAVTVWATFVITLVILRRKAGRETAVVVYKLATHKFPTVMSDFFRSVLLLVVTANVVPIKLIIVTLMIEATSSSETSVLTKPTRRHIP
jgi:hypothetical protein